MGLVAQKIGSLLGGVSQLPALLRQPGQHAEQINGFSRPAFGLSKRPPTVHRARLATDPTGYTTAFVHAIIRDAQSQYRLVVANGLVKVYNVLTGAEVPVYAPKGLTYLTAAGTLRGVTVGDTTFLTNGGTSVQRTADKTSLSSGFAIVSVRQTGPGVVYSLTVNGSTYTHTCPSDGSGSARSTDLVAEALRLAIVAGTGTGVVVTRYGSSLYLDSGSDKTPVVSATDGLGDSSLVVIPGVAKHFTDLPSVTKEKTVVKVAGDPTTTVDDYWVQFSADGVWRECPQPGTPTTLDASTMPHTLTRNGSLIPRGTNTALTQPTANSWGVFIDPKATYPVGAQLRVWESDLPDAPFIYTVTGAPQDGKTAALGLKAVLISAGYGVTYFLGRLTITGYTNPLRADAVFGNGYAWWDMDQPANLLSSTAFDPKLSLTAGSLVGYVLKNLADGSQGTITANSVTTVTAVLSGGVKNAFAAGDTFEVLAPDATYFVFDAVQWKDRGVGSLETVPFPSFLGKPINELFFHQNRLGFLSGEAIVLSRSGDLTDLFRATATQLLDDDPIDVKSATAEVTKFHSVSQWNSGLYLHTEQGEYLLSGDPALTPRTVRLDPMTHYGASPLMRPVVCGERLFFGRTMSGFVQVTEYDQPRYQGQLPDGSNATEDVPTYLPGSPKGMAGDGSLQFLAVLTDAAPDTLYVYQWAFNANYQQVQSAWHKWTFTGATILSVDMVNGVLGLVVKRSDGVCFETLDVGHPPATTSTHADRQGWTATVPYTFDVTLSPIYFRDPRSGDPETRGKLIVRSLDVVFASATELGVEVSMAGRSTRLTQRTFSDPGSGKLSVPVQGFNTDVTLRLLHSGTGGCELAGVDWQGTYTTQSRRL